MKFDEITFDPIEDLLDVRAGSLPPNGQCGYGCAGEDSIGQCDNGCTHVGLCRGGCGPGYPG